ncbi:restriction endonuclease subunit S [Clostridium perfringens]
MTYMNLIDVCDFQGGSQPPKDKWITQYKDGYIRMLQIRDFTQKRDERDYVEVSNRIKICKKDDVLIARYGASVGKILTGLEGAYNVAIIKSIPSKLIDKRYLYYYFNSSYFQNFLKNVGSRAAQAGFNKEDLREAKIFVPKIEHQRNIVSILNKSKNLIERRKNQIEQLDLLVKSKFIEMFGDPFNDEKGYGIKKLGEVTEVNPKKSEIKELDKDLIVSFVPMDRVSEKGEFAPELSKPISEVYNGFTYFKDNDVLFAKITPCMENGKGAIAINLSNGIGFGSTEFHVLRPIKDNSNPYWIYHLTTLIEFRRLAERKMTGSAGQKRVPTDFLNNVEVVIPPIELQNQFADFAKQVDKLKFEMEKSLKELEDNFNSLMNKAFKGELF